MKAGRELDVLVSDKIFGSPPCDSPFPDGSLAKAVYVHGPSGKFICPRYSTEIAAAWKVVEKMRHLKMKEDPSAGFTVWVHWEGGYLAGWSWHEMEYYVERGDTAPLAICLSALETVSNQK